jgi:D-inositol-3-phosphate glycosyltransferase
VPVCIADDWLTNQSETPREPQIVWLGKFRRYKCPDHAIRAMPEVLSRLPRARLILAGFHDDRSYEDELRRLADRLGLGDAVNFRFGITDAEKRALLDSSWALVLPSSVEGFGIVVLEANARRVPVVASSGVPLGAVEDGRNGLRYPFGDVRALAQTIIRITTDDRLHEQLARQSLAFARQFEFRTICREYERVLLEAVSARSSRRVVPAQLDQ